MTGLLQPVHVDGDDQHGEHPAHLRVPRIRRAADCCSVSRLHWGSAARMAAVVGNGAAISHTRAVFE